LLPSETPRLTKVKIEKKQGVPKKGTPWLALSEPFFIAGITAVRYKQEKYD
jgi:hypothetical protein